MTILICNQNSGDGFDVLTDEHAASSYGVPVLVHNGQALGPADMYDEGPFGQKPVKDVAIKTGGGFLTEDELALLKKWRQACASGVKQ